jgi:hypothetical protein
VIDVLELDAREEPSDCVCAGRRGVRHGCERSLTRLGVAPCRERSGVLEINVVEVKESQYLGPRGVSSPG